VARNLKAAEGTVFVCAACGKRSQDLYGDQRIDAGWDVSCVLHAVLCYAGGPPWTIVGDTRAPDYIEGDAVHE
jgi:hypothetical protein